MRSRSAAGGRRRRWLGLVLAFFLIAAVAAFLSRGIWLPQLGLLLIHNDEPLRADAILVLAGDDRGDRVLKGAELGRSGYAPVVYISGSGTTFNLSYADLSRQYAVSKGYPANLFRNLDHNADSTREEAAIALDRLRSDNVRRLNIVTSDYHTARTRRVFSRLARDIEFRVIAAPSWNFRYDNWWQTRRSQKMLFLEYTKTVADLLGI